MANIDKLAALKVAKWRKPGLLGDGGGLYLQVTSATQRSWLFRFQLDKKQRAMGLGSLDTVSLAEAREAAREARRLLAAGVDPIEAKHAAKAAQRLDAAKSMTFRQCADAYIASHRAGWKNAKHGAQWASTLATYAYPIFGDQPVQSVDVALVMRVLQRKDLWTTKPETASRVRGRIESILDWATASGYRQGENPARWRGHLENLLPSRAKVARVEHHVALPYDQIGDFMAALREQEGVGARALEFAILTASRTGEVIGARWDEIDLSDKTWAIPADRMKGAREHRVPLSPAALAIVEAMAEIKGSDFIFPGFKAGKPLSNMALLAVLKRMERADLTSHGFRSTFKDWATEQMNFPAEVSEMALAHALPSRVEAAYRRGDLKQKRGLLMDAWATYCSNVTNRGDVIPMRRAEG